MNNMKPPFLIAQFELPSLIQPRQVVPSLASKAVSGTSMSSAANVDEIRWLMLALEVEFTFVDRSAAAVPCCRVSQLALIDECYLFADPRDVRVVDSVSGDDLEDAAVLVGGGPERALSQRHVVEQVSSLLSARFRYWTDSYDCAIIRPGRSWLSQHDAVLV